MVHIQTYFYKDLYKCYKMMCARMLMSRSRQIRQLDLRHGVHVLLLDLIL